MISNYNITPNSFSINLEILDTESSIINLLKKNLPRNTEGEDLIPKLEECFNDYYLFWSSDGNKDFNELKQDIAKIKKIDNISETIGRILYKKYKSNKMSDKKEPVTTNYNKVSEKDMDFLKDESKSKNERIKFSFSKLYSPNEVAKLMGIKSVRVSSVYSKLKKSKD